MFIKCTAVCRFMTIILLATLFSQSAHVLTKTNYIKQLVGRSLSRLQFGTMCALYIAQTL